MRRASTWLVVVVVGAMAALPLDAGANVTGCGSRASDFDGDGRDDVAVGIPFEGINAPNDEAGAVHVLYGSAGGVSASGDQFLHQDASGVAGFAFELERFGWALATGDFDGDGRDDLAVGVPNEDATGAVQIFYGSADGLTTSGDQLLDQNTSGMAGTAEFDDGFGAALAACDFDGDGRDDLAVGVPGQVVDGQEEAGAVHVIYGSSSGLTASGDQIFDQGIPELGDQADPGDLFGDALTAGDFDGNGRADLAIGVSGEGIPPAQDAGLVHILRGSSAGLTTNGNQIFHQDATGVAGVAQPGDEFGFSVAAGDFDGDGRDDLAVGIPFEDVVAANEGAVHIFYGSASGLTTSGDQIFHEDTTGIADASDEFEEFGEALAVGDFDADGRDDLAVSTPGQDFAFDNVGAVHVIYGSADGLTASGDQFWHQDVSGVTDSSEVGDNFGEYVSAGDFDGDGRDDLVAGIPNEDLESPVFVFNAGAIHTLYGGASTGLTSSGDQFIHQNTSGVADTAEANDHFGSALVGSPFIPAPP